MLGYSNKFIQLFSLQTKASVMRNIFTLRRFTKLALCVAILLSTAHQTFAVDARVLSAQKKRIETIKKVIPSVVAVFGPAGGGGGSGVLISADGFALTNFHVTSGSGDYMKCGLNDGKLYDAVIVGIDPSGDVALIKLLGRNDFPVSALGDSDKLEAGDSVYAMGNPFLLATDYKPTVTFGVVSGVHRYQYPSGNAFLEYADCIQTDASINPGNSGGPLFNASGELVGINGRGSFEKRGRVNSGAGYAISINQIKKFMDHLKSGRIVDHATLGAAVSTDEDGRVVVSQILEGSEPYRRGLREGDEIVSLGGHPVGTVNQFKNALGTYPKGWKVPLIIRREDQKKRTIIVRLEPSHHQADLFKAAKKGKKKPKVSPKKGIEKLKNLIKKPKYSLPKKYAHMLSSKPGYMNYYFNEQAQKPILAGLKTWGNFSKLKGQWEFKTTRSDGSDARFAINDKAAAMYLKEKSYFLVEDHEDSYLMPTGSNGMLQAMYQLRQLLVFGKDQFPTFEYIGSEPLDGTGVRVDVIHTLKMGADCRWYFDKSSHQLVGFDMFISESLDPCSVRFTSVKKFGDHTFPDQLSVLAGDNLYDTFKVTSLDMKAATKDKKVSVNP